MITILIRYKGKNDNAKKYVEDMLRLGYVDLIRSEEGNLSYQYFEYNILIIFPYF